MKPKTDAEYVAVGGMKCPYCNSGDIRGDEITIEGAGCTQEVWCEGCGRRWWDVYTLVGYEPDPNNEQNAALHAEQPKDEG